MLSLINSIMDPIKDCCQFVLNYITELLPFGVLWNLLGLALFIVLMGGLLYGIVRHPMYSATLFLFISMGFVLASPISVAILLLYIPIIAKRMKNEEKILEKGLEGYTDYKKRVKYKVIPFVW